MNTVRGDTRSRWQAEGAPLRATAARAVNEVLEQGRSLKEVLQAGTGTTARLPHFALVQELVYGTLRFHPRLAWFAQQLLERRLPSGAGDIEALLLIGLYQLEILETPAHVAVSCTVEACRHLRKPWACALVNAVLRNYVRQRERLRRAAMQVPTAHHAHPDWLIDRISKAWPEACEEIFNANNTRPPMTLRVNRLQTTRADYLRALTALGIDAAVADHAACGVRLTEAIGVGELPGFAAGQVSVQDEAAQLAATLLDLQPGQRVLDACAAPGGKTAHLLEQEPDLASLVAVELDPRRVFSLRDTLARLQLDATVVLGDARQPDAWWDRQPFDRILLDAPCSATGVIRRHPDIKSLRRPQDIPALAATQRELLDALWPLLARGGKLLYATCSILPEENDMPVLEFLSSHLDAEPVTIDTAWGRSLGTGRQILPGGARMDGFFYALLAKR